MRISSARRWAIPVVAGAAFVGAGPLLGVLTSSAHADLPPRTPQQLLVDVQRADLAGLSGTITESADLGLPALPDGLAPSGSDPLALLTGSHTMRVWTDGRQRSRVALLSQYGESDLIRNGTDVWAWTSDTHRATHWTLSSPRPVTRTMALTPQQVADRAVASLNPTTVVTGDRTTTVAGRPAYVLELKPRSATTLVRSVEIDIDGATHVPTRVAVYATDQGKPALSVGFSHVDPSTPPASVFAFTPGPGVKVKQAEPHSGTPHTGARPRLIGSGWDSVLVTTLPHNALSRLESSGRAAGLLQTLPRVSGAWGSGRLLESSLFSAVLTDDGRVAIGAVPPDTLYAALT